MMAGVMVCEGVSGSGSLELSELSKDTFLDFLGFFLDLPDFFGAVTLKAVLLNFFIITLVNWSWMESGCLTLMHLSLLLL